MSIVLKIVAKFKSKLANLGLYISRGKLVHKAAQNYPGKWAVNELMNKLVTEVIVEQPRLHRVW